MRNLYLVPLMLPGHTEGSAAGAQDVRRDKHRAVVRGYWETVSAFFSTMDVSGFKLYLEGMVEEGEKAIEIIRKSSRADNPKYRTVLSLIDSGAVLQMTEDASLFKQEQEMVKRLAGGGSWKEREQAVFSYGLEYGAFLRERDKHVAGRINGTLGDGESGILFCGIYRRVLLYLPGDIRVRQVKDMAKVRSYYHALYYPQWKPGLLESVSVYLTSPVEDI